MVKNAAITAKALESLKGASPDTKHSVLIFMNRLKMCTTDTGEEFRIAVHGAFLGIKKSSAEKRSSLHENGLALHCVYRYAGI